MCCNNPEVVTINTDLTKQTHANILIEQHIVVLDLVLF